MKAVDVGGSVSRRRRLVAAPGQGLVEYALIVCMIALVVVAAMLTMGTQIGGIFSAASLGGVGGLFADCKPLPPGQGQGQGQQHSKAGWCPPGTG